MISNPISYRHREEDGFRFWVRFLSRFLSHLVSGRISLPPMPRACSLGNQIFFVFKIRLAQKNFIVAKVNLYLLLSVNCLLICVKLLREFHLLKALSKVLSKVTYRITLLSEGTWWCLRVYKFSLCTDFSGESRGVLSVRILLRGHYDWQEDRRQTDQLWGYYWWVVYFTFLERA